jgi:salicylate hydroxylase
MCNGQTLEVLASADLSRTKGAFGSDHWTVHRVDLHNELLRLATDEYCNGHATGNANPVKLSLRAEVVQATQHGTVVLHDGSVHTADLVVAADGLHSVLRDAVLGSDAIQKPRFSGSAAFRFLADAEVLKKDEGLAQLLKSRLGKATMLVDTEDQQDRRKQIISKDLSPF